MTTETRDASKAVGLSMTTIFDLESIGDNDLSGALRDADKAATLARLAVEGLMVKNTHSVVDAADLNLVQECIYTASAHAWHARTLHEADVQARSAVHPPLGEPVTHGERGADCPVCGGAILAHNRKPGMPDSGTWEDHATCTVCDAVMHEECHWGRVASLAEFQEYRRQVVGGTCEDYVPDVRCASCRAKGEAS